MCSPLLFKVFLRPSFGACAPPSPNSARNLYFLRRVGRLLIIIQASRDLSRRRAPLSPKGKACPQSVKTFCFSVSAFESKRQKVFPLGENAFPFGEGGGIADGRGHCLPFRGRCRHCRRKRSLPSLSGKVAALPTEEVIAAGSVPTWRTLCKFLLKLGEMPSP